MTKCTMPRDGGDILGHSSVENPLWKVLGCESMVYRLLHLDGNVTVFVMTPSFYTDVTETVFETRLDRFI